MLRTVVLLKGSNGISFMSQSRPITANMCRWSIRNKSQVLLFSFIKMEISGWFRMGLIWFVRCQSGWNGMPRGCHTTCNKSKVDDVEFTYEQFLTNVFFFWLNPLWDNQPNRTHTTMDDKATPITENIESIEWSQQSITIAPAHTMFINCWLENHFSTNNELTSIRKKSTTKRALSQYFWYES